MAAPAHDKPVHDCFAENLVHALSVAMKLFYEAGHNLKRTPLSAEIRLRRRGSISEQPGITSRWAMDYLAAPAGRKARSGVVGSNAAWA